MKVVYYPHKYLIMMRRLLNIQVSFFAMVSMMMSYYAICQGFSPSSMVPRNNQKDVRRRRGYGSLVGGRIGNHIQSLSPLSHQQEQHMILQRIRGGALRGNAVDTAAAAAAASSSSNVGAIQQLITPLVSTPSMLFRSLLVSILSLTFLFKMFDYYSSKTTSSSVTPATATASTSTPQQVDTNEEIGKKKTKELQLRFLPVFWILRLADWLQGPYFYEVYASKAIVGGGMPSSSSSSLTIISRLFLTGFASTALFGPISGQLVDTYGRKRGTLAFCLFYMLGALSTKSNLLPTLLLGRIASGIGTSLLFSAPESWLVGDAQRMGQEHALGSTFGLAYAGDSIVAIVAGQLAALAASYRGGPTGPFELSLLVLAIGALLTSFLWKENVGSSSSSTTTTTTTTTTTSPSKQQPTIQDALRMVLSDPKIASVGAVQSLFEAAMYIFVLQWPPAISSAISAVYGGATAVVPYGTIFSCFMACCLMGATLFSKLNTKISKATATGSSGHQPRIENSVTVMLLLSTIAVGLSAAATTTYPGLSWFRNNGISVLSALVSAFFAFEIAVGFYFPSIGTLRSKYIPDSHRSVIMNLFGIPLNALVVSVFLRINSLGIGGALTIATAALSVATIAMFKLMLQTKPLTA